jgi:tetratricopeptide (TPR) repeat protein/SAM-dependent methyltransferase
MTDRSDNNSSAGDKVRELFARALQHHQRGELSEAERCYREVLAIDHHDVGSLHYLGLTALQKGQGSAAIDLMGRAIALNATIPELHYHIGMAFGSLGRFEEAATHNRRAIELRPGYAEAHMNLGNSLKASGNIEEALESYRRALSLAPRSHLVLYNIANVLSEQRQFDEAITHYQRAIELRPDYAEAYNNLGAAHADQGRFDQAIALYRQALALAPGLQRGYLNLGDALRKKGDLKTALDMVRRALSMAETAEAKVLCYLCLKDPRAVPHLAQQRDLLIRALSEPWGQRGPLATAAANLLARDPAIVAAIEQATEPVEARPRTGNLLDAPGFGVLKADPLFQSVLLAGRVPRGGLERLLTVMRAATLVMAAQLGLEVAADGQMLALACTLARLCFLNEYVFMVSDVELDQLARLRATIAEALGKGAAVPGFWLAAIAAYDPLHALPEADRLLARNWPPSVQALLALQIEEPRKMQTHMAEIVQLTPIEDSVSLAVRQQYEENPYPRWEGVKRLQPPQSLQANLQRVFPQVPVRISGDGQVLEYLIAGCGTGQHVASVAQDVSGVRITAIDLSRASLGYAKHMTVGLGDISFAQADILRLGSIGQSFDVIDATGVLHHMNDWEAGWQALLSILRPNGLMRLGFYSEIARRRVVDARTLMTERGFGRTADDIRRGRQEILALPADSPIRTIANSWDFYSLSECRDLLFHVQEHRLNLAQIERFLTENGLEFIGFELNESVTQRYSEQFPDDATRTKLANWQVFEEQNPDTFAAMYQFWVQRREQGV